MWWFYILFGLIIWVSYSLDKRLKRIEEQRGQVGSQWFVVNAMYAVPFELYGKYLNISSAKEGKPFEKWTKTDKERWSKYKNGDIIRQKLWVKLSYISSEDAFVVENKLEGTNFCLPKFPSRSLYSTVILGNEDEKFVTFNIDDRHVHHSDKYPYIRVLSAYIEEHDYTFSGTDDKDSKNKPILLFDFPFFINDKQEKEFDYSEWGFEVKRDGGDDIYEDGFGEKHPIPAMVKFIKNKAEIRFVS